MECTECGSFLSIHPSALDFNWSCPSAGGSCDACNSAQHQLRNRRSISEAEQADNRTTASENWRESSSQFGSAKNTPRNYDDYFEIAISDRIDVWGNTEAATACGPSTGITTHSGLPVLETDSRINWFYMEIPCSRSRACEWYITTGIDTKVDIPGRIPFAQPLCLHQPWGHKVQNYFQTSILGS